MRIIIVYRKQQLPRDDDVRARAIVRHDRLDLLAGHVGLLLARVVLLVAAEARVVGDDHAHRAQVLRPSHLQRSGRGKGGRGVGKLR